MRNEILYRFLFFAAWAMGILSGCSKSVTDEFDAVDEHLSMRFDIANMQSRTPLSKASLQDEGAAFKVWGIYYKSNTGSGSASLVFDGTTVTKKGTAWTYDDPRYWTPGFAYNFRAIYPAATTNVALANQNGRDNAYLTVSGFDATSGIDLLAASSGRILCNSAKDVMPPVQFRFRHLLSRVAFVGRSDEKHLGQGRQIIIDEAKLYGIHTSGNWSGENAANPWTVSGTATNPDNTPYVVTKATYPDGLALTSEGVSLFVNELFIPQGLDNCILAITFHYNVGEPKTFTREVRLASVSKEWEAGKSYRYPFTIDEHIFFETPVLEPWEFAPVHNTDFNVDHLID